MSNLFTNQAPGRRTRRKSSGFWGPLFAFAGLAFLVWATFFGRQHVQPSVIQRTTEQVPTSNITQTPLPSDTPAEIQVIGRSNGSPLTPNPVVTQDHPTDKAQIELPKPTATSGSGAIVRWRTPFATALILLETNKPAQAVAWLQKNQAVLAASDLQGALNCETLQARAYLALRKFDKAIALFEKVRRGNPKGEVLQDVKFGYQLGKAKGNIGRLPWPTLKQIADANSISWGSAMAAYFLADRLEKSAAKKPVQEDQARFYYQKALLSKKLERSYENSCLERLLRLTNRFVSKSNRSLTSPASVFHEVAPGENLTRIAVKYKTSIGAVRLLNGMNAKSVLQAGKRLRIIPGRVRFIIDRWRLTGTLYFGSVLLRRFPIGMGPGTKTPNGAFTVRTKQVNPDWYYNGRRLPFGHPENILGTRWMGFDKTENDGLGAGLGVHGTGLPKSVPGRESKGCIRMRNQQVEELFELMPYAGKVIIIGD